MYPSKHRASILVTVLWTIIVMSIIALGMAYESRSDVDRTILMRDRADAYWIARSGVEYSKHAYAISRQRLDEEYEQKGKMTFEFERGYAVCVMESETSRMPINSQNVDLWRQAFKIFAQDDQKIDELVDAVFDWRDKDEETRTNGAEAEYYQSLTPPYQPRNGTFMSVEEILLVKGITEDMYYGGFRDGQKRPGLKELLSIDNPNMGRFDINTCPKEILIAFLEITPEDAESLIAAREEKVFENVNEAGEHISIEAAENLNKFFIAYRGNQFRVRSTGHLYNSPIKYTVEDDVRYVGGSQLFMTIAHKDFTLEHVDGTFSADDENEEE